MNSSYWPAHYIPESEQSLHRRVTIMTDWWHSLPNLLLSKYSLTFTEILAGLLSNLVNNNSQMPVEVFKSQVLDKL